MSIKEIYEKYRIPPQLQTHMLRVAGVGKIVCDNFDPSTPLRQAQGRQLRVTSRDVITACLLHDMGNIIKFNLTLYPEFLEPEGLEYWQNVQNEFIEKYGEDEHIATQMIAREIGVSERTIDLLSKIGFSNAEKTFKSQDFEEKIVAYADQRVGMNGVLSIRERHSEGRERFLKRKNNPGSRSKEEFDRLSGFLEKVEKQIFDRASIRPNDINDNRVDAEIEKLKIYEI